MQFTLASLQADYRSNILTAGVQSTVGGYATPGYTVLVYPFEGSAALPTVAGTDGRWSQRLTTLPQTRWVYAGVQDPKRRLPDKFYRINISTQQQEVMEAAEFARIFPPPQPGKAPIPANLPAAASGGGGGGVGRGGGEAATPINLVSDDSDAVKARAAEDDRVRLKREREEEGRRKRRELEERIDQRLRDAERRERTGR